MSVCENRNDDTHRNDINTHNSKFSLTLSLARCNLVCANQDLALLLFDAPSIDLAVGIDR